ncbi:MAG: PorV/PorQ family protein [Bacteroidia bacterium]|nr:PorV/PorQ family protein [Bacteroidia bacterium]
MKPQYRFIPVLLAILFLNKLSAQPSSNINFAGQILKQESIYTAASYLLIPPGAANTGMGNAGVATANDALASYYNPAGLAFSSEEFGVSLTYSPWLRALAIPQVNFLYFSTYTRLDSQFTLGTSFRSLDNGDFQFGLPDNVLDLDKNLRLASDLSLAYKINRHFGVGASLRWISVRRVPSFGVQWDREFTRNWAGDISMRYQKDINLKKFPRVPLNFSGGIHLSNLGTRMVYSTRDSIKDYLPTNLRLGWALKIQLGAQNSIRLTHEIQKLLVPSNGRRSRLSPLQATFISFTDSKLFEERAEYIHNFGMEYSIKDIVFLRQGFFRESHSQGQRQIATYGIGTKHKGLSMDMSYWLPIVFNHPLKNTFIFSLAYEFTSEKE